MLQLSPVIAGCMKWGQWGANYSTTQYLQLIEECIANKITSFDHADIYGDYTVEEEFGATLKQKPHLREQMQLITKCGIRRFTPNRPGHKIHSYDTSRKHIISSAERSLKNLNTDFIDLLLIHRPDPLMDPHEIAEAFGQLKKDGKALHFGVSNFTPSQMEMMAKVWQVEFNQLEVSVIHLDPFHDGSLDKCIEHVIRPMSWGPLGSGKLHSDEPDERSHRILAVAKILAGKYKATVDQVLLAFVFKHPSKIIPVIGSTKIERLKSAYEAAEINIEREEWFMLWRASKGHEVP
ncbi:MAG TPA: aldo/keto reductase [Chitinophagaceae bacterium]|nr:aldo/keto reductase [Chitinophagaceae bacterium]